MHYAEASETLTRFAEAHDIPVAETQAGKSALPDEHPLNMGAIGVTGTSAANALAAEADVVLAVGTRLQDFTTGSWALFRNPETTIIGLNVQSFDAEKHGALPLVCDAKVGLERLSAALGGRRAPPAWAERAAAEKARWRELAAAATAATNAALPSDAQVIGAVQRARRAVRYRRLRRRRPAGRAAQAVAGAASPAATTSNTAIPAWATRSPAASASRWRGPSAR